ncbi:LytTR family DNA-binding domain-containing protein [Salipiger abyssi]|uniref:LytTR family DNA-binding domain-containing protein n=1 Tax=Salipiger abyssi TaxID=1250539 RepID=UPI001A8DA2ED|nr:LytTR family DNA-binding domain-containing protein [Salipiger abyssi]MBN9889120.1 LytTR family transcriptional regulator [Salipiger abyssi]
MHLRSATFEPLELSAQQFLDLFQNRLTWRYMSLVFVILIAADPSGLAGQLPAAVFLLAWLVAFLLYLALQSVLIVAIAALRQILPRPAIYWPIISLFSFAPTLLLIEAGVSLISGEALKPMLFERMLFIAITVIVFETMYMRFVLPRVLAPAPVPVPGPKPAPTYPAPADTEDGGGRLLVIGGQPVALQAVELIEAHEHHVHVRMRDDMLTQRARLSDIVAQTGPEDGVQPHRSWWVARGAVAGLDRESGKPVLRLADGKAVPVARGRLADVRNWIATYLV